MLNPYSMRHTEEKCLKRLAFLNEELARTEDNEIHYRMRKGRI